MVGGVGRRWDIMVRLKMMNERDKGVGMGSESVLVKKEGVGNGMRMFEVKGGGRMLMRVSNGGVKWVVLDGMEGLGVVGGGEE